MEVKPLRQSSVPAGYKKTEVGVIPEDWDVQHLSEVCSMKSGQGITSTNIDQFSEYPCYGGNGLRGFAARCTHDGRYALIGRQGALCGNVVGVEGKFFASEHAIVVTGLAQTDIRWLTVVLQRMRLNQYSESSAQPGLSVAKLLRLGLALPPTKAEQRAIAGTLSDADALIESLEQLIAKKRDIKQGTMQQLLTGKNRLQGFTGEWEVRRLGDVVERFVGGGTPSRSNQKYWGGDVQWVTVKDFATFNAFSSQETITREGLQNSASHLIPKGTLITATRMALGRAVVYEVDAAINQDLKALFPIPELITQYLYFWFQYHGQSIDELGSGSTVKGISLPDLKKIEFQLPPLPEQTAIVGILSDMDAEIAGLEAKLEKARLIKLGMMQELLTGRIRLA